MALSAKRAKAQAQGLRYVGDGTIWRTPQGNVPPRDLTAEEVARWGGVEVLAGSGLYAAWTAAHGREGEDAENDVEGFREPPDGV